MSKNAEWLDWLKAIVIAILAILLLRQFGLATSVVQGDSMYPALENGEKIIFNKFVYLVSEPNRGDIIIIQQTDKNYVKRIVGMPNETIEMKNHTLYINNEPLAETFVDDDNVQLTGDFGPYSIPANHYFVIGDNRARSKDSRNGLGFIERSEIIGRSEFVIFPFNELEITR